MKLFLILICALVLIVFGPWFVFSPNTLQAIIEDSLSAHRIDTELHGLKKGLLYTIHIDRAVLRRNSHELISLHNLSLRIHPVSLFISSLRGAIDGEVYGGTISGSMKFTKDTQQMNFSLKEVSISEIVFLKRIGLAGKGTLSGTAAITDAAGHVEFAARDTQFEPATYSGRRVPLNMFRVITGALDIQGDTIHMLSVSFEGEEVFARLKGKIQNAVMDLAMEIMPGRSFAENPFLLAELEQYKVSPGYFVIPVKGNLPL